MFDPDNQAGPHLNSWYYFKLYFVIVSRHDINTNKRHTAHKGLTGRFHQLQFQHPPIINSPLRWTVPWIHMTCVNMCTCVLLAVYILGHVASELKFCRRGCICCRAAGLCLFISVSEDQSDTDFTLLQAACRWEPRSICFLTFQRYPDAPKEKKSNK